MNVQRVPDARETRGNHVGLAVNNEADVAYKSFVKNSIHPLGVIFSAVRKATHLRAFGRREFAHGTRLGLRYPGNKSQSGWCPATRKSSVKFANCNARAVPLKIAAGKSRGSEQMNGD